jgi:hypothetical protein
MKIYNNYYYRILLMAANYKCENTPFTSLFYQSGSVTVPGYSGLTNMYTHTSSNGNYFKHQGNVGYKYQNTDIARTYLPYLESLTGGDGSAGNEYNSYNASPTTGTSGTTNTATLTIPDAVNEIRCILIGGGGGGGGGEGGNDEFWGGGGGSAGALIGKITVNHSNMHQVYIAAGGGGGGGNAIGSGKGYGRDGADGVASLIKTNSPSNTSTWTTHYTATGGNGGKGGGNSHGTGGSGGSATANAAYTWSGNTGNVAKNDSSEPMTVDWGTNGPSWDPNSSYGIGGAMGKPDGNAYGLPGHGGTGGFARLYFIL